MLSFELGVPRTTGRLMHWRAEKAPPSRLLDKFSSFPLEFIPVALFLVQHGGYFGNTIQDFGRGKEVGS